MAANYGKEKYCKFCWACYHGVKCICADENRKAECKKARARMGKNAVKEPTEEKKQDEAVCLKEYLKYIPKRIAFLKSVCGKIPSNEYKYYCALQAAIKKWGRAHALFYGCVYGKIGIEQARGMVGVSERTFYRIMSRQRKLLIDFIEKQENILNEKYPFIPIRYFYGGLIWKKRN